MTKKAAEKRGKQELPRALTIALEQIALPMMVASEAIKKGLMAFVQQMGMLLPSTLCRTFSTTNAIENMNGTLRRVARNVKRWRGESMIQRWVALGVAEAERGFRRVKGHAQMHHLVTSLRPKTELVQPKKAA